MVLMDLRRANNEHVSSPVCAVKPNGLSETPHTERKVNKGEIRHLFLLWTGGKGGGLTNKDPSCKLLSCTIH